MVLKRLILIVLIFNFILMGAEEKNCYPVVFVHGIAAGVEKWGGIGREIGQNEYYEMRYTDNEKIIDNFKVGNKNKRQVWNISYYTENVLVESLSGDLGNYSMRLKIMIDKIKKYSDSEKVIIIAHSMGGLIARNYMIMSENSDSSVYKLLTVATPNEGVEIAPTIVGQLTDLNSGSKFILNLNKKWRELKNTKSRWGIVAAFDRGVAGFPIDENSTDSGGIGFVKVSSSVPFGAAKVVLKNIGKVLTDLDYSSYVILVEGNHNEVIKHEEVRKAINWAME